MKAKKIKPTMTTKPVEARSAIVDGVRVAYDGTREGDPIPGSKQYRAFCRRCGEPGRATSSNGSFWCVTCHPPHSGVGNPHGELNDVDHDPDAYARALDQ